MNLSYIDVIFLVYMFIGLYMTILLVIIFYNNRNNLFDYPIPKKLEGVSIIVPCYNDGENIGEAIESLLELDYPKELIEVIVVDDKSSDNSVKIAKKYEKKYSNVRVIENPKNSGGAAMPTNIGIRAAKFDYIAVADADSMPKKDAIKKMIGFLQEDEKVGGVTCSVLVRNPKNFIQKLQAAEYTSIAFSRKLLDKIDSVYVTPGPFALYRKKILLEVGLFDTNNLTQDIEVVWRLLKHGYIARMSLATSVYSQSPDKFRHWLKQRIRWTIGGTQTLFKYSKYIFRKKMLGNFVVPFFALSTFLGLAGLALFSYLFIRRFILSYLITKYSISGGTALFYFQDFTFAPSILNYFGFVLFVIGVLFSLFSLMMIKDRNLGDKKFLAIAFYMTVYLTIYPVILVIALFKMSIKKYSW